MSLENEAINKALSSSDSNEPGEDIDFEINIEQIESEMNIIYNCMVIAEDMTATAYKYANSAKIEREAKEIKKKGFELTLYHIRQLHKTLPD